MLSDNYRSRSIPLGHDLPRQSESTVHFEHGWHNEDLAYRLSQTVTALSLVRNLLNGPGAAISEAWAVERCLA